MTTFLNELAEQLPAAVTVLLYAYGLFLITWPVFLLLEHLSPAGERPPHSNYRFNWLIVVSNFVLTPVFYALAATVTSLVGRSLGLPALPYPGLEWSTGFSSLDVVIQAVALFAISAFVTDLWYYWWHRMQHELHFLWEIHKLHHSDEQLNATTIYRSHFFELAGQTLVRGMTVGLIVDLAAGPQTLMAVVFAGLLPPVWDFFIHANVRFDPLGRLLPFISTTQFHWIHHSRLPEHQDKNYAIWLPLFDKVFGSYYAPRVDEYPPTGLSSGEQIETLWAAQVGPLEAWGRKLRRRG